MTSNSPYEMADNASIPSPSISSTSTAESYVTADETQNEFVFSGSTTPRVPLRPEIFSFSGLKFTTPSPSTTTKPEKSFSPALEFAKLLSTATSRDQMLPAESRASLARYFMDKPAPSALFVKAEYSLFPWTKTLPEAEGNEATPWAALIRSLRSNPEVKLMINQLRPSKGNNKRSETVNEANTKLDPVDKGNSHNSDKQDEHLIKGEDFAVILSTAQEPFVDDARKPNNAKDPCLVAATDHSSQIFSPSPSEFATPITVINPITMSEKQRKTRRGRKDGGPSRRYGNEIIVMPTVAEDKDLQGPERPSSTLKTATSFIPHQGIYLKTASAGSPSSSGSSSVRRSDEFTNFGNVTIPTQHRSFNHNQLRDKQDADFQPRMNDSEKALSGPNIVTSSNSSTIAQPGVPPRIMQPVAVGRKIVNRRPHAIPIRAPPPELGTQFATYHHGIPSVPSHYVPLHGAAHGVFFDTATKMIVGDGPPRATLRRLDGSFPGTTKAQMNREIVSNQADDSEDSLHIHTATLAQSVGDAADFREAIIPPAPPLDIFGPSPTISSLTTRPFKKLYFCICTRRWESHKHNCPKKAELALPNAIPARPGTVLPADWVTHRLQIDATIYPDEVVPGLGSAAAYSTSAVGGRPGADLPERWFAPCPLNFEFDFGQEHGEIDVNNLGALMVAADAHEAGLRNSAGKKDATKEYTNESSEQTTGEAPKVPATAVTTHIPVSMSAKAAGKMPEPREVAEFAIASATPATSAGKTKETIGLKEGVAVGADGAGIDTAAGKHAENSATETEMAAEMETPIKKKSRRTGHRHGNKKGKRGNHVVDSRNVNSD